MDHYPKQISAKRQKVELRFSAPQLSKVHLQGTIKIFLELELHVDVLNPNTTEKVDVGGRADSGSMYGGSITQLELSSYL